MSRASEDARVARAVELAASLLVDAEARRSRGERRQAARMARLLRDPAGRTAILALTDEVLRVKDSRRAARLFAGVTRSGPRPWDDWRAARWFAPLDRAAFVLGGRLAPWLPSIVVPLARRRVQAEMAGVILSSDRERLARHIARRRAQHIRVNVNVLGEAVLGEAEAEDRLGLVLDTLAHPSVDYVSVKISSICSQLDVLAYDAEVARIAVRLRRLYRAAAQYSPAKFVNLDMEEFRDLELTTAVFKQVLDEDEFHSLNAGIVLQAYLPDSASVLEDLAQWARQRGETGGGWIKVRIVKGANLAMEAVEAEVRDWAQAPFGTKEETDVNYKRMLAVALDPGLDGALRVGVASHNLFELAWAVTEAQRMGAGHRVELEMLEGMSPAVAEAVAARMGGLLLYAPVVRPSDTEAAIAYLVRRFDENSGPDNFIAHQFGMTVGSPAWEAQQARFRRSVAAARQAPDPQPSRRTQDRSAEVEASPASFVNCDDTDFTGAANRRWAFSHIHRVNRDGPGEWRPVVSGAPSTDPLSEAGIDPSRAGDPAYKWAPAGTDTVARAVEEARKGQDQWQNLGAGARRDILRSAARQLQKDRGRFLAVMEVDSGKTVREGDPEVSEAVDFAAYYADHCPDPDSGFRPYGTVAVVSPWNFPLSIPAGGVLASLAAGNTVILKPPPETVAVAGQLAQSLWAAGVPPTALHFVPCRDDEAGQSLITSPGVDAVILTGSWDTARLFLGWRPDLDLHAETSGKNAMVVTATADPDTAIADLVHSAFGHAGQKCSAASLAIVEADVYDDGKFLRRLADAVRSLRVGPASDPATAMGPLIRPPDGPLADALRRLEPGESWLVEPRLLDEAGYMWSPGVKVGVAPGSPFHLTECFGPVLGVMRAGDLDEALRWQNQPLYGLTAGLQALDPLEIEHWRSKVEAGNLYVNRGITGAIVQRQPFGGWKRSVVGPGAKAGGPNYVASLGRWPSDGRKPDAAAYRAAWREMARPTDPTGLRSESNVFRYRPLRRVAVHGTEGLEAARAAASAVGVEVTVVDRIPADAGHYDKLRLLGSPGPGDLAAAQQSGLWVDTRPVVPDPARELLTWVREQAVSESRHRHGNVTGRRPGLLPPPGQNA